MPHFMTHLLLKPLLFKLKKDIFIKSSKVRTNLNKENITFLFLLAHIFLIAVQNNK